MCNDEKLQRWSQRQCCNSAVRGNDTLTNSYVFTRDTSANIRVEKTKHILRERNKIEEAVFYFFQQKYTQSLLIEVPSNLLQEVFKTLLS